MSSNNYAIAACDSDTVVASATAETPAALAEAWVDLYAPGVRFQVCARVGPDEFRDLTPTEDATLRAAID